MKMKKKYLVALSVVVLTAVAVIYSCKKDDEKTATKEQASAVTTTSLQSDAIFDDLYKTSESLMTDLETNNYSTAGTKKSASLTTCYTITVDKPDNKVNWPKTITVTFNGCYSGGLKKNGKIIITQSNKIRETDAVRTITLENFTINDTIMVEGKKTITNKGLVNGKPTAQIKLENGKITFNGKYYITRNFTRTFTWKEGFSLESLFNIYDDVYAIYETASGSTKDGFNYSSVTTDSLEYKMFDYCIKKGKIKVNVGNKVVYVDFNRQTCSDPIKVSIDGEIINTELNLFTQL